MEITELPLAGLKLVQPRVLRDQRGFFLESYKTAPFAEHGIDCAFVQDNHSRSVRGTLRGLHYQGKPGQAKLVRVARGRIFDVAVDIRRDSSTFGQWHGLELDDETCAELFVPVGFAHGFCVLSEVADVVYKVSTPYHAKEELTITYDDPDVAVAWPSVDVIVSERDRKGESLQSLRDRGRTP